MLVQFILDIKKGALLSLKSGTPVTEAARILRVNNIGAVPILDTNGRLIGILSERDIMGAVDVHGSELFRLIVDDIMTHEVITCKPTDSLNDAAEKMRVNHIRHLPIVDGDKVYEMISSRDLFALRVAQLEQRNTALRKLLHSSPVQVSRHPTQAKVGK